MTVVGPVERVSALLTSAGYQQRTTPLKVGSLQFDVAAAFVGKPKSMDLVLIFDTAFQPIEKIQRTVLSIARTLDVAKSRRSLTTILTGARPEPAGQRRGAGVEL